MNILACKPSDYITTPVPVNCVVRMTIYIESFKPDAETFFFLSAFFLSVSSYIGIITL